MVPVSTSDMLFLNCTAENIRRRLSSEAWHTEEVEIVEFVAGSDTCRVEVHFIREGFNGPKHERLYDVNRWSFEVRVVNPLNE